MSFVHLHVHSQYSLLDGLTKIPELVARAKELKMPAIALTDHGALYGAVEFYETCLKEGVKPILGEEMYVAPTSRHSKKPKIDDVRYHLTVLVKNAIGYTNLLKLTSAAHCEGYYYKPRIDWELLERHHEGLIILSGCLNGEVASALRRGNIADAEACARRYQTLFGDDYYLEIQPENDEEQRLVNHQLVQLSERCGIPLVATQDSHYLLSTDAEAQDTLLCLQTKAKKDDRGRLSMLGGDYSLRSPEEMRKIMSAYPRAALENTVAIAEKTQWTLDLSTIHLPHFDVPDGKSPDVYLRKLCDAGIENRYGKFQDSRFKIQVQDRLDYELDVIKKTGFASYFLIVQDVVNWAKGQGIIVGPGRGSAAGSIVSYLTNITNIDPLAYDLVFERFLNPERAGGMPDIDLDFADTRRDEVIRYVEQKYGKDHVAQIVTFGTMAARAVVRDVGRVLGFPYAVCDRLAKLIPFHTSLADAIAMVPELHEMATRDPEGQKLVEIAQRLEGVARHTSTHACGVLITEKPLTEYVPVQFASSSDETIISQYSLHPVEALGLLKMDFLGLKNLSMIERTLTIVRLLTGRVIDIDTIPLDDASAFRLLQEGKTRGVFQLESEGMRRYLKQLQPTSLEDIIAMVSLYRPGPMELIPDYIAGKHGTKTTTYLHPKLEPILAKTYGVAVYQEQVLQIARDLAGFTLGEADILRKAVGKKIRKLLREQKKKFVDGCVANGIAEALAKKIFDFIEPFAGYGFNRSHGACYALIAYQTAYLKANEPAAFMAALLTTDEGDTDRMAILVEESRLLGIEVLPPDINESMEHFTVVPETARPVIRFGLVAVKNVGAGVADAIITERKARGEFTNLEDFLGRLPETAVNKKPLESLIKCGALDRFGDRAVLLENLESLLSFARRRASPTKVNQATLFGSLPDARLALVSGGTATKKERLLWERSLLGLYVTEHPWETWKSVLGERILALESLDHEPEESLVATGGIVSSVKRIVTKGGEPMAFVTLEDLTTKREVVVFPRVLEKTKAVWIEDAPVMIQGRVSRRDDEVKILCENARTLTEEAEETLRGETSLAIRLGEHLPQETMVALRDLLQRTPGPYRVFFLLPNDRTVKTDFSVPWDGAIQQAVESLLGPGSAELSVVS